VRGLLHDRDSRHPCRSVQRRWVRVPWPG
jgi:hypothetical protein